MSDPPPGLIALICVGKGAYPSPTAVPALDALETHLRPQAGAGEDLQLGIGQSIYASSLPAAINSQSSWAQVSAGDGFSCGIESFNGRLLCWGNGEQGQLGTGAFWNSSAPTPVSNATEQVWVQVSAGSQHACAISSHNELLCYGAK